MRKTIGQVEEFSIECSMIKVFATEACALAAEECLQMLGGYGYCQEYPLERLYRDERINRIFEGTNEINRMLVPGMIMRKALKGELPFLQAAKAVAWTAMTMHRVVDGRLTEGWLNADLLGLLQQLGVLPPPAAGG